QNYIVAWDLLQKRCNKPRLIIQSHLKLLLELPEINRDSASNLRTIAQQAQMHVNALRVAKQPVEHWDAILIYLIVRKLDKNTRRAWERTLENDEMPTFEKLIEFINKQARGDDVDDSTYSSIQDKRIRPKPNKRVQNYMATTVRERFDEVRKRRLYLKCFRNNHTSYSCSSKNCRKCGQKHNTLLHFENSISNTNSAENNAPSSSSNISLTVSSNDTNSTPVNNETTKNVLTVTNDSEILLGTARVKILDKWDNEHTCRVLLDGGSQAHFITDKLLDRLQLDKENLKLCDIELADPDFDKPAEIDLLLGCDVFYKLITSGRINLCNDKIVLQSTKLGWIVTGEVEFLDLNKQTACFFTQSLDDQLSRFWEVEEISNKKPLSLEETICEEHFTKNTYRDSSGRFVVRLPFNDKRHLLGQSREIALRQFLSLERKLLRDNNLLDQYTKFLEEYEDLGHMSVIQNEEVDKGIYLPHYCVFKESSITTKIRVVFDA
ncbi:uncharacterized protein LOC108629231, partial [Ceratina calcarata]|uniref:Uncharacterized protein LOC108629231 n=1 Tax=Ceratina calcarata TaxID=156304 RepID=A0AAJ7J8B1_9HYME